MQFNYCFIDFCILFYSIKMFWHKNGNAFMRQKTLVYSKVVHSVITVTKNISNKADHFMMFEETFKIENQPIQRNFWIWIAYLIMGQKDFPKDSGHPVVYLLIGISLTQLSQKISQTRAKSLRGPEITTKIWRNHTFTVFLKPEGGRITSSRVLLLRQKTIST